MKSETQAILRRILKDIQVEMSDEFDQNFEREAFFSEAWQRRRSPMRPDGHILVDTGQLRRSIQSRTTENSITFYTDLPYAAIHNEGGSRRNDKRTVQLSDEAEFWKFMALKKAGTTIKIPRRRFLGNSPEVEQAVRTIIEENLSGYIEEAINFEIHEK